MRFNSISFLLFPLFLVLVMILSSCSSLLPKGDKGDPGVALIKTYTGTMTGAELQVVSVPEIKDKSETTFVKVYKAFASTPNIWSPMSDGWLDGWACSYFISWSLGEIAIYEGFSGDLYKIQVYQNN